MGNWTPGPWRIERSAGGWVRAVCDSDGRCVCYGSIEDADAALIAAAPELADALRELLRILDAAGLRASQPASQPRDVGKVGNGGRRLGPRVLPAPR